LDDIWEFLASPWANANPMNTLQVVTTAIEGSFCDRVNVTTPNGIATFQQASAKVNDILLTKIILIYGSITSNTSVNI
jgi:hypothetical protein